MAPAKLEDVLLHHEAVADVGVIGVPDLEAGELPKAYVVIKGEHDVTKMELVEYVAGNHHNTLFFKLRKALVPQSLRPRCN